MKPTKVTIRSYQVGFGDCFLLTFAYPKKEERHVLIDFGSTGQPDGFGKTLFGDIANNIAARTKGKLHAVVATHRHKDHISGFATDGTAPGAIIAACQPDVVLQPWTEDPAARTNALKPTQVEAFTNSLRSMQGAAQATLAQLSMFGKHFSPAVSAQLGFLGEDNLPNRSAVENLQAMGKTHVYAHAGSTAGLDAVLPGVTVHVLGPPTLEQADTIRKQRATDRDEFWHLQARFWQLQADTTAVPAGDRPGGLFPHHAAATVPVTSHWLRRRLREIHGEQLLELVRTLDSAMNNTSLILLFTIGTTKLLFPGDAQIENWSYALQQPEWVKLLADVDVYKVGHHGSLNATPKSLWQSFTRRGPEAQAGGRLRAVISTMTGKHGSEGRGTEVPRSKLVEALQAETDYFTTQSLRKPQEFFRDLTITIAQARARAG